MPVPTPKPPSGIRSAEFLRTVDAFIARVSRIVDRRLAESRRKSAAKELAKSA